MRTTEHGIESSGDVEDLHHLRLMALLQELVREKGYKGAARVLEIDHRTVAEIARTGRLSRRVREALERALQEGIGSAADRQRERNDRLEQRVEKLEGVREEQVKEMRAAIGAVEDAVRALREDTAQAFRRLEGETAQAQARTKGSTQGAAAEPGNASHGAKTRPLRCEYPDLVTLEPADDDGEVFGDAWPLIVEWRTLKNTHLIKGKGLAWLAEKERLLVVELALLETHGMTLPPEKRPLRGFDRDGQTIWRRKALFNTRRERAQQERRRWMRRVLTLGLWWE